MPYKTYAISGYGKKAKLLSTILDNSTLIKKRQIPFKHADSNTLILTARETKFRRSICRVYRCITCADDEVYDIAIDFKDTAEDIADLIIMVSQLLDEKELGNS